MSRWEFYRHMPVYLRNGRLLGRVEEVGHAVDYLHVQEGHLLVRDWYVPMDVIASVTPLGVRLTVERDALRQNRWNIPPEEFLRRQGLVPGYEYTSRV